VKPCCDSRLLFRRSCVRYVAFKVRHRFLARRESEPEDAWGGYEIAQAILIVIGNNQSLRAILLTGCLYDRVVHTGRLNEPSHNVTICPSSNNSGHPLATAS
jgi:hypothetical protein